MQAAGLIRRTWTVNMWVCKTICRTSTVEMGVQINLQDVDLRDACVQVDEEDLRPRHCQLLWDPSPTAWLRNASLEKSSGLNPLRVLVWDPHGELMPAYKWMDGADEIWEFWQRHLKV